MTPSFRAKTFSENQHVHWAQQRQLRPLALQYLFTLQKRAPAFVWVCVPASTPGKGSSAQGKQQHAWLRTAQTDASETMRSRTPARPHFFTPDADALAATFCTSSSALLPTCNNVALNAKDK